MTTKRTRKRRRRGTSLRLPSGETTTPVKMVWGSKPAAKRAKGETETAA